MKHLTKETCQKIKERLGAEAPDAKLYWTHCSMWWGGDDEEEWQLFPKGHVFRSSLMKVGEDFGFPAYGIEELLMPGGIIDKIIGEDPGGDYPRETFTTGFVRQWHKESWEEAEKYLSSLL